MSLFLRLVGPCVGLAVYQSGTFPALSDVVPIMEQTSRYVTAFLGG